MDKQTTSVSRDTALEEQIRKLNAIGIALSQERDLNKLLEGIVRQARHFTHADAGSLYIREGNRLNFTVAQTASLQKRDGETQPFKSFYLPLSKQSIAGYVALTGELLNIDDVYEIPADVEYQINKRYDQQNNYRSKSMLVVPMRDPAGSILGVLQLINSMTSDGTVVPFESEYESLILSLASQAAVAIRNVMLIEDIRNLFKSLVRYSAKAIDSRSPHTAGHSGRVAKYSVRMAQAINEETDGRLAGVRFSPEEIEELRMAGWLHDIGKIGVPESVLEKVNKLTDVEIELIRQRFESVKHGIQARFLEKKVEALTSGNGLAAALPGMSEEVCRRLSDIDDAFAFITRVNVPGQLSEDDCVRLRELSERTYVDVSGQTCQFLTRHEYENLSVVNGNLTVKEYREIQAHVTYTLDILEKIPFTSDLRNIPKHAAAHHEYLDGSGYPLGLRREEISLQSRILCIADIYDALSSPDRPYKKATPLGRTLEILRHEAESGKLDADIVDLFIRRRLYEGRASDEDDE